MKTQLSEKQLYEMYQELKQFSEVYVECSDTEQELYNFVESQLRDLECNRVEYQELTDSQWNDLQYGVWEDLCETYEEELNG